MNTRRYVFVTSDSSTGVKTTLPLPSEPVPTLKMAIGSLADTTSRIAIWKIWSEHSLNPVDNAVSEIDILVFHNERLQHRHSGSHEVNEKI